MQPRLLNSLSLAATVVVALAGLLGLALLATFYYLKPTLPDVALLRDIRLQVPLRVYSRDGLLLAQIGEQRRVPVRWDEIPQVVVHAVLAAEDDRFFEHPGVDWQGVARAALVAATTLEASQGGSTLTQQLVRTVLITREKQLRRKLREIFLSLALEDELDKQEIFTLFVNSQFLGQRSYGFAAAAEAYFGKPLATLGVADAALLAGILQAPSRQNPVASPRLARERRAYVLRRMRELGYLDEAGYQEALQAPVPHELHGPRIELDAPYLAELVRQALFEEFGERLYSDGFQVFTTVDSRLQRTADIALRSTLLEYDRRHGYRGHAGRLPPPTPDQGAATAGLEAFPVVGGLQPAVIAAVDPGEAWALARDNRRYRLPAEELRWARPALRDGGTGPAPRIPTDLLAPGDVIYLLPNGPDTALLAQVPDVQGAFVALDPHDGAIVALSAGFDYRASKFNRVTQARRQPGSSFKPFVYSAALENGFTPASVVLDAPIVYDARVDEAGIEFEPEWRPMNDSRRFYGPTRLRDALARSRNLVTIRVMRALGIGYTLDYVQRFGLPGQHIPRDLTAALGTAQLTPLEMAAGFAVFANGGSRVTPYFIERVTDADGRTVRQAEPPVACADCSAGATPGTRLLLTVAPGDGSGMLQAADAGGALPRPPEDRRAPRAISEANAWIMSDMLADVIRVGTGQRARALGRPDLAGKTGTTNDGRDAWFSGFNPDLVATAWVGFDQERPLGPLEEGARTALPMWIYFMQEALRGRPVALPLMPDGVVMLRIPQESGDPAGPGAMFEYFLADHLPTGRDAPAGPGPGPAPARRHEEPIF